MSKAHDAAERLAVDLPRMSPTNQILTAFLLQLDELRALLVAQEERQ